ncbi:ammonia monooxygenase, partial [bacterium M00.F.Ca.ET.168.01.1.1]
GDYDRPTFQPSVLVTGVQKLTEDEYERVMAGEKIEPRPLRCHSFVTDGQIQFLSDCTHALAGQTVALHVFDEEAE